MRLVIISNRLPVTATEKEGTLRFEQTVGGLVSGLGSYLDSLKESPSNIQEYIWVGWPGTTVREEMKESMKLKMHSKFSAYPVFLSERDMEKFYLGFCNKTIWPLFHYFSTYTVYDEDYWLNYQKINKIFCDTVMEIIKLDDVVWVHDYHLMLLPKLLRERMPDIKIGFFLHIPFPTFEVFRLLPGKWRIEILEGLLGSDLIGFHTYDYTQYFLRCVNRILGYNHNMGIVSLNDRVIKADTFPMGIDYQKYSNAAITPKIKKEKDKLKKTLHNLKVILSIDRLDYSKGTINRLMGYEKFLEKNPEWHGKVVLIAVVVPSRIGVYHYQQMKTQIDELVGSINGKFGSILWTPILYQYKSLKFPSLTALYSVSDVILVTPLRDGMNLIAKEYIASRTDKTGVLILSEMAGASNELGEAIIINPNNTEEIANALKEALEMPIEEQVKRNQIMQTRLTRYDVRRWANDFIKELFSIKEVQKRFSAKLLSSSVSVQLIKDFKKAKRRLILLDYDGTLVPFAKIPQMAFPDNKLLNILARLSDDKKTDVVLISGRDKKTLQSWFGMVNINMVAEHGAWIKEKSKDWKMIAPLTNRWKNRILPILETYADRLPGSFVEEKEFSIVWHYRRSDPELASLRVKELTDYLVSLTANIDIQILQGNKVIEIRNSSVNKGVAVKHWISKNDFDFILAVGDDWTDEDLFRSLPETAYSIRVGMTQSNSKFNLHNYAEVRELLEKM